MQDDHMVVGLNGLGKVMFERLLAILKEKREKKKDKNADRKTKEKTLEEKNKEKLKEENKERVIRAFVALICTYVSNSFFVSHACDYFCALRCHLCCDASCLKEHKPWCKSCAYMHKILSADFHWNLLHDTHGWAFDPVIGHPQRIQRIGSGSFGVVTEVEMITRAHSTPRRVVCKTSRRYWLFDHTMFREMAALQRLHGLHFIPRLLSIQVFQGQLQLFMTLGLDCFHDVIFNFKRDYENWHIAYWMSEICLTLANAHSRDVIHCDLKPGNLVLMENNLDIMLVDWGASVIGPKTVSDQSHFGITTSRYRSPELWRQQSGVDLTASDVWSAGCILLEFVSRRECFAICSDTKLEDATAEWRKTKIASVFSPILEQMLCEEAVSRCSAADAAQWFKKFLMDAKFMLDAKASSKFISKEQGPVDGKPWTDQPEEERRKK